MCLHCLYIYIRNDVALVDRKLMLQFIAKPKHIQTWKLGFLSVQLLHICYGIWHINDIIKFS